MRTLESATPPMGTRTPEMTNPVRMAAERGSDSTVGGHLAGGQLNLDQLGRECNSGRSAGRIITPEPPKDLASI